MALDGLLYVNNKEGLKLKKLLKIKSTALVIAILFVTSIFSLNASAYGYGAYCQGIDWADGNNRYQWVEKSQNAIAHLRCSQVTMGKYNTGSGALAALKNCEVFIVHTHGSQTTVNYRESNGNTSNMTTGMINGLPSNALSNLKFAVYGTCSAGKGGAGATNIVNSTANKGAKVVIGFKDLTYVPQINQYLHDFLKSLGEKRNTYQQAMKDGVYWAKFWNWGNAGGTDNPYTRGDLSRTYYG